MWIAHERHCEEAEVYVESLQYYDFDHDGNMYLVVVASDCEAGTFGPNVQAVYVRDGDRGFRQLSIPEVERPYYDILTGNRRDFDLTVDMSVESGLLVATWHDEFTSGKSPLVIRYRWNGKEFIVHDIDIAKQPTHRAQADASACK